MSIVEWSKNFRKTQGFHIHSNKSERLRDGKGLGNQDRLVSEVQFEMDAGVVLLGVGSSLQGNTEVEL